MGYDYKTNLNKTQVYQNIKLRNITNAQPYVSNQPLHNEQHMKTIEEESAVFLQAILFTYRKSRKPIY